MTSWANTHLILIINLKWLDVSAVGWSIRLRTASLSRLLVLTADFWKEIRHLRAQIRAETLWIRLRTPSLSRLLLWRSFWLSPLNKVMSVLATLVFFNIHSSRLCAHTLFHHFSFLWRTGVKPVSLTGFCVGLAGMTSYLPSLCLEPITQQGQCSSGFKYRPYLARR